MHLTLRIYAVAGLIIGYVLVMLANPVRLALRDGFRCLARYERVWLTFALLGFAYFVFQFVAFSSLPSASEINFAEIISATAQRIFLARLEEMNPAHHRADRAQRQIGILFQKRAARGEARSLIFYF